VSAALPPAGVLRFGVQAFQQNVELDGYAALWRRAEELGLEWASVYDHFLPVFADPAGPCFEGPTLLAALATQTRSIRCGILVAGNTYRHPAVLANVAATLDHVSHGRLELGLGAGWFEPEHRQYGIPFPPVRERLAALREAAIVIRSLWTEEETTLAGRHYTLTRARCEPKPVQRPHPPLWIGGTGERVLLRVVAELADGWNSLPVAVEDYERLARALAAHCAELGRDPGEIRRSLIFQTVLGETEREAAERLRARAEELRLTPDELRAQGVAVQTVEQCAELLGRYVGLGVGDLVLIERPPFDERTLELLAGRVAPAVRG
jgi:F420-dependent oxidoreductase-like protein